MIAISNDDDRDILVATEDMESRDARCGATEDDIRVLTNGEGVGVINE